MAKNNDVQNEHKKSKEPLQNKRQIKNSRQSKNKNQNNNQTRRVKNLTKAHQATARQSQKPAQSKGRKTSPGKKQKQTPPVRIAFLGGLNEIGKNMTLYEYEGDMFIVDCGLSFPDQDMFGVDLVIPDFTYVAKNADKIKGIVITHGHEDHIGGLAYLLKTVNIPVYSTKLTIGLIEGKLKEHGILGKAKLNVCAPGDIIKLGKFSVELIHVNHSIPDSLALAIKCEAGTIIQTGDFKIDTTPIDGEMIDLARFAQIGKEGVLCMLSDSTNAERPGYTESESKVGESFETLFRKAGNRRIIVATFASNIHRVQQIINVAKSLRRKVVLFGRSLENVVAIGSELGYLNIPDNVLVSSDLVNKYSSEELVIITTGSQGEPMSALTRMAFSDHKKVEICPNDYVIISATPIPGNEKTVGNVVNELMKLGAEVVYEKMYDVHVSGHACQEELKLMMGIVKPKYFIPVHGEQKHMFKHALLAESVGLDRSNIFIADNGVVVELTQNSIKQGASVPADRILVDGNGVGDIGNVVLKDRKRLAEDGIIVISAAIDYQSGELINGPEVVTKGFVYVKGSEEIIDGAKHKAEEAIYYCCDNDISDINAIKSRVRDTVFRYVNEKTKRNPMVLPLILEV
ncbi:MAG: ribonuclease J [Clostridia bacterium]|nr:ribonuclease J [Clostridia bacterium]